MNTSTPLAPDALETLARKRVKAKMGWLMHAFIYAVVNIGLTALSAAQGHHWSVYPALGWGIGLAVHGAAVWMRGQSFGLYDSLLQRERQRLQSQRDPW